jgi:hypothetical protein
MIFKCYRVFKNVMASNNAFLARVAKVRIITVYEYRCAESWGRELNSDAISQLKRLKGLELELGRYEDPPIFREGNVMNSITWLRNTFLQTAQVGEGTGCRGFCTSFADEEIFDARMKGTPDRIREELQVHEPLREVRRLRSIKVTNKETTRILLERVANSGVVSFILGVLYDSKHRYYTSPDLKKNPNRAANCRVVYKQR